MASGEVKLLGSWPSPFVMRVRVALNIKSVDYEFLEENLANKSQLLLQSNPIHKKVPVLIHGDKPICESQVIVQYIDEAWSSGCGILPSDPYNRATARFWTAYMDDKFFFSSLGGIARASDEEAEKASIQQVEESLPLLEDAFTKCSKGKPFFGGDQIGYIDLALGCFLAWIRVIEKYHGVKFIHESKTPELAQWAERFCSDPAVKDVMPETEKLAEFAKLLFPKYKNFSSH